MDREGSQDCGTGPRGAGAAAGGGGRMVRAPALAPGGRRGDGERPDDGRRDRPRPLGDPPHPGRRRARPVLRPGLGPRPGPAVADALEPGDGHRPPGRNLRRGGSRRRSLLPRPRPAPGRRGGLGNPRRGESEPPRRLQRGGERLPRQPPGTPAGRVHRPRRRPRALGAGGQPGLDAVDEPQPGAQHEARDPAHRPGPQARRRRRGDRRPLPPRLSRRRSVHRVAGVRPAGRTVSRRRSGGSPSRFSQAAPLPGGATPGWSTAAAPRAASRCWPTTPT